MKVTECKLPGALVIEPKIFGDHRGFFLEMYNEERYRAAGLSATFVQDNLSFSRKGVLRGLHFQNPTPQGKLVSVLQGAVFDVAVDLRRASPTFGQWFGLELDDIKKIQFYIPPGFAHGFVVTSDTALFAYKCTALYNPASEKSLAWNDPDLGITWPKGLDLQLSPKDQAGRRLKDFASDDVF